MTMLGRLVWLVQGVLLLALGGFLVADPREAQALLPTVISAVEIELVELFAPLGLGLGVLTLQLLRPSFAWMRASLSSAFVASWLVVLAFAVFGGAPWPLLVGAGVLGLGNLAYTLRPQGLETPPSARPNASAEAPMLGKVWGLQMLYYTGCGVLALVAPSWVVDQLFTAGAAGAVAHETQIMYVASAMYIAMALVSHHAVGAQTDETWRGFCQAFLFAQWTGAIAMTAGVFNASVPMSRWTLVVILPSVGLALVNTFTLFDRNWIRRFVSVVWRSLGSWWVVQTIVFGLLSYVAFFHAGFLIEGLTVADKSGAGNLATTFGAQSGANSLATDAVRLVGPLALACLSLTVLALLRQARRARHDFALLFLVWGAVSLLAQLLTPPLTAGEQLPVLRVLLPVVLVVVPFVALANLIVWLFPDWRTDDERYQGAADTKPPWVFRFCVIQAVLFGTIANLTLFAPSWTVDVILRGPTSEAIATHPVLVGAVRATAPFWALISATALYTARSAHEWSWRGLCRWFAAWQAIFALTFMYVFDSHLYIQGALVVPTVLAVMVLTNLAAAMIPLGPSALAGQPAPSGWLLSDTGQGLPLIGRTVTSRARAYHRRGVGATGVFEPSPASELPRAAFFAAQDGPLLCTARFSNRSSADDAGLDVRGCALRLSWPGTPMPMDLLMATGAFGNVSNAAAGARVRWSPRWLIRRWLRADHAAREAAIAGIRRAPSSFAALRYHGQLVRTWTGVDADGHPAARECRLRLVPEGDAAESGLPDAADESSPWVSPRRPDDPRPPDYLHAELTERLGAGEVRLHLQAQLAPITAAGNALSDAWYDAAVDWAEDLSPWLDVGTVLLHRPLPDAATDALSFQSGNGGGVLSAPPSASWKDPRSLAVAQDRVMRWIGQMRLTLYRVTGRAVGEDPR